MCLLVRLLVPNFFLDIAACYSASKMNAKLSSEESIFVRLAKGMHLKHVHSVSIGRTGDSLSKRYTFHHITVRRQRP